jgi:hypothetical protein
MKRFAFFLAIAAIACLAATPPATAQQRISIDLPGYLGALGIGPSTAAGFLNDSPLWGTVVSFEGVVGDIDPNSVLYDPDMNGLERYSYPIAIVYFDSPARNHIVGIATDIVRVERGRTLVRSIRLEQVKFLDGGYARYRDNYPYQRAGSYQRAVFPRIICGGRTVTLVANATLFDVQMGIMVNEPGIRMIPSGGLHWLVSDNQLGSTRQIELVFTKMSGISGLASITRSVRPVIAGTGWNVFLLEPRSFPRW